MRKLLQLDIALLLAALAGGVLFFAGPLNPVDTFQYDLAVAQNQLLRSTASSDVPDSVAVVAVDERSLDKFGGMPRVLLAPKWADLIDALAQANAAAMGFDIVFAYPDKHFASGWENGFLRALSAHKSRIVLGRSERIVPALRFQAALDFNQTGDAFGAIEVQSDADKVHRAVEAEISVRNDEGRIDRLPTLSRLLLKKAGKGDMPATVRLAPKQPLETIATYSLWDVLQCAGSDPVALRQVFQDKIVLIGTTLAGEDRKWSPDRFMTKRNALQRSVPASSDACTLNSPVDPQSRSRQIPSIYLHAAAINAVAAGRVLEVTPTWLFASLGAVLVFAAAWLAFQIQPWWTLPILLSAVIALQIVSSISLGFEIWLPTASIWIALASATLIAYLFRILLVERRARLVQSAFNHYLTEELVDRIAASDTLPVTGGERRDITVMFADLSGFTALSEKVSPETLMELTNTYLSIIVDEIHATGGYVDKFIGDAVMAIWGAPADDPDHAFHGVQAAQRILAAVQTERNRAHADGAPGYAVKVALNSGPAIVGNVGAKNRLNYSAVGRTVNIAARIEELLSKHGTAILCGEETAAQTGDRIDFKQVGEAQLKGLAQTIKIFAPTDPSH